MPTHLFRAKDGSEVERYYRLSEDLPARIRVNGKTFTRQIGTGSTIVVEGDHETIVFQATEEQAAFAPRRDDMGHTLLRGKKEIRKFQDDCERLSGKPTLRFGGFGLFNS